MASVFVEETLIKSKPSDEETFIDIFCGENKPFRTMAGFFSFCAALGYSQNRSYETKKRVNEVRDRTFQSLGYEEPIFTIALSKKRDPLVLDNVDDCYKIYEDFINGGLSIIKEEAKDLDNDELVQRLLTLVHEKALENMDLEDEVEVSIDEI